MEKIQIDEFARYKFLSGIKHSPNGHYACYAMHQIDMEENKYCSNLWVLDVKKEQMRQLTSFDSEKDFIWMDDENILFPSIRNSKDKEKQEAGEEFTQLYKINIHGGEAVKFIRLPRNANSIKMIDADTFIFTSEYNPKQKDMNLLNDDEKAKELSARKEEKDYEVIEEIPFWSNGKSFTSRMRNRLYIYHANEDAIEAITDEYAYVEQFNLNADKTKAVIIINSYKEKMPITNEIMLYDISNKKLIKAPEQGNVNNSYANFISNDKLIIIRNEMKQYGAEENNKFYTMDLNTMETIGITPELDVAITNSVASDCRFGRSELNQVDGGYLYYVTTEVDSSYLNRIDASGKTERMTTGNGTVDGISIKGDSVLYIGTKAYSLQELFRFENTKEKQITTVNKWIQTDKAICYPEKISFESEPGVTIDGWIIKPIDFDETKKYPAILDIHGGPKTAYGLGFVHEMQYWASEGYAVFFCNPRGSDGKGNAFADITGKYGTIDYRDIMRFTDEVLRRCPFIDANRVGVTGGSYGGYMTNWIIGHTDRFKAAASQRSISNWTTEFCTTDIGYFFVEEQCKATPWDNYESLWEQSPLKYADRVKTPTLFIHSDEDYRCWITEAFQMFTALKYHGVEARLCMFRGENHELSRSGKPKHRVRRLKEITDWFNMKLVEIH